MFALLPRLGGVLLGWIARRKIALAAQLTLFAIAVAMLTISAPEHGAHYSDSLWIAPALAVVSAGTLLLGFWIARRNGTRTDTSAVR